MLRYLHAREGETTSMTTPPNTRQSNIWARRLWPVFALLYVVGVGFAVPAAPAVWLEAGSAWSTDNAIDAILVLLTVLLSLALSILLYIRRRNEPMALFFACALLPYAFFSVGPSGILGQYYLGLSSPITINIGAAVNTLPMLTFFALFPGGRLEPRWMRWLIPAAGLITLGFVAVTVEYALGGEGVLELPVVIVSLVVGLAMVAGLVQRFRRYATLTERQQMKWGLYGFGLQIVLNLIIAIPFSIQQNLPPGTPEPWWVSPLSILWGLSANAVPLFFTIAVLRAGLWSVDLIIRRTLQYTILTAILGGVYIGGVTLLQSLFTSFTGSNNTLAVVISTLAIAALFRPLQTRLQRFIDRRFFRQKYDAARILADFAETVRDEIDVEDVQAALVRAVDQTMQPEAIGLWVREGTE